MNGLLRRGIRWAAYRGLLNWMPDEPYLKLLFAAHMGRRLNLKEPKTFNEKLQWLKLHDRRPGYTAMVDKLAAKDYAAARIGGAHIIPTLGVWDRFSYIDFAGLPDRFVLKCTHDSGGLVICRDKAAFDVESARRRIENCLKRDYCRQGREWPYQDVPRRVMAEQYMRDRETGDPRDYKFFVFHGAAKVVCVVSDRQNGTEETKFDYFDMDFRHLDLKRGHPFADPPPRKPETFAEMRRLAEKLAADIPHGRVDLYEINGRVYFGELTFYTGSGFTPFSPAVWDRIFGDWLRLPTDRPRKDGV